MGFPKSSNNPKGIFDHKMTGWINKRVFFRASHGQIFFEFIITIFTSSTTGTITKIMKDASHFSIIYIFQFFTYHSGLKMKEMGFFDGTFPWRKSSIKECLKGEIPSKNVPWWRSAIKEVNDWALSFVFQILLVHCDLKFLQNIQQHPKLFALHHIYNNHIGSVLEKPV